MIRVVLDANILVAALLNPRGAPARLLLLLLHEPDLRPCLNIEILAEYEDVLRRPKFALAADHVDTILQELRKASVWCELGRRVYASPDRADNKFLECCEEGQAEFLITGNLRHFPSRWCTTRIVTARQFLDANE